ncbi:nucleotide-binding protein [Cytophagaceae bacterium ABcell3]|nr:nucleotide-binding protein [Cytophagaceae bacterium ABcell3]
MTELKFYLNKLHNLQYRGDWKEPYGHIYSEVRTLIYNAYTLRKNFYLEELDKYHKQMMRLPYIQNNEDKLQFRRVQKHLIDLLYLIKEENKKIYIVYGKDSSMKDKVSSFLGRLRLDFVVVDYEDKGKTYLDFHEAAKDCEYAVVLLSADNHVKSAAQGADVYRASQKVLFQLGYFLANAGRKNVILFRSASKFIETPFDFTGLAYNEFDMQGDWKKTLVSHLKASGVYIDEGLVANL